MDQEKTLKQIEMDVLEILVVRGEVYGLEVLNLLNEGRNLFGMREIGFGTFYPVLKRLSKEGLINERFGGDRTKEGKGARRKYYRINSEGLRTLEINRQYRVWFENNCLA